MILKNNKKYKTLYNNDSYFYICIEIDENDDNKYTDHLIILNYSKNIFELKNIDNSNLFESKYIIGSGANGIVYLGFDKENNKPIAIKQYTLEKEYKNILHIKKEEEMYKIDNSPIFIKTINDKLILNYYDFSLANLLDNGYYFYKDEIKTIINQLCDNIILFFNNNLIHSDIKPDNILIGNNQIFIIDRGSFINLNKKKIKYPKYITTVWWSCKSANQRTIDNKTIISKNADTHALCIILIQILIGRMPKSLRGHSHKEQNDCIDKFLMELNDDKYYILKDFKNLINLSLSFDSISPIDFKKYFLDIFDNTVET